MGRLGRNLLCSCGSGRKWKHCHGRKKGHSSRPNAIPPEVLQRAQLEGLRHEAKELRRKKIQGLGKPILSVDMNSQRVVYVGGRVYSSPQWKTFHDFLLSFIQDIFTREWWEEGLTKPLASRHPIFQWHKKLLTNQRKMGAAGIQRGAMTGAIKAYFSLAYDLYLCAHNTTLPKLLVTRLKNPKTFEGALYEAYVIGIFARAGFDIKMENEEDSNTTHCEFEAIHRDTKRQFSVEAKAFTSASSRSGASNQPPKIRDKIYKALVKNVKHERIIFAELNRVHKLAPDGKPEWASTIDAEIRTAENELTIDGKPAPPAFLFITNRAFMHDLEGIDCEETVMATGFKINDFPQPKGTHRLLTAIKARERHQELHWILKSLEAHDSIPSTFNDLLPEEVFSARENSKLRIGEVYQVPDGSGLQVNGVLTDGIVIEGWKKAVCTFRLENGRHIHCNIPLSEAELAIYKSSPETFFDVVRHVSKGINSPIDAFDFFFVSYSKTPKEKLLDFMASASNATELERLSQRELAELYCERLAAQFWNEKITGQHDLTSR
jgi:hypothetical protein